MTDKILFNLFLLNLLSFVSYLLPSTFYPEIGMAHGMGLPFIGFVNCLFPVSGALTSMYLGNINTT